MGKLLPGRIDNDIKNRYFYLMRQNEKVNFANSVLSEIKQQQYFMCNNASNYEISSKSMSSNSSSNHNHDGNDTDEETKTVSSHPDSTTSLSEKERSSLSFFTHPYHQQHQIEDTFHSFDPYFASCTAIAATTPVINNNNNNDQQIKRQKSSNETQMLISVSLPSSSASSAQSASAKSVQSDKVRKYSLPILNTAVTLANDPHMNMNTESMHNFHLPSFTTIINHLNNNNKRKKVTSQVIAQL